MDAVSLMTEFPIASQTSDADKVALLKIRALMPRGYAYMEIGSFMGGSLVPFLRDPACALVTSIDTRPMEAIADERPGEFVYGVTLQVMLDELLKAGVPTDKLSNFVGSIDQYSGPYTGERHDLLFIDGEHTDVACFRDFVHGFKFLKPSSIVVFHDTTLASKGIRCALEFLRVSRVSFRFVKVAGSEISFVMMGKAVTLEDFDEEPNLPGYFEGAQQLVINIHLDALRARVVEALK